MRNFCAYDAAIFVKTCRFQKSVIITEAQKPARQSINRLQIFFCAFSWASATKQANARQENMPRDAKQCRLMPCNANCTPEGPP
jgi:hypothetical protein